MTTTLRFCAAALAVFTIACTGLPPVRMDATPGDYERLAGKWRGEYTSTALGRHGTIDFQLTAGTNKASGAVVMIPQGYARPYPAYGNAPYEYEARSLDNSHVLTIAFVRANDGSVRGILDRYWDPDRSCFASSVFRGVVEKETIAGTFVTTWECGQGEASGEWKVTRRR